MKKILVGVLLIGLVLTMVLPGLVSAVEELSTTCTIRKDPGITGCPGLGECDFNTVENCAICCLISTVYYITDWMFMIAVMIVVVFSIYGAFEILTSAGNTDQFGRGQKRLMFAAIGLAIALFARAIPGIVKFLIQPGA